MTDVIKINHLKKVYNKKKQNSFTALNGISLQISKGEMAAVIGKSGAGKSTLMHILACMDDYDEGEYFLDGQLIKGLTEKQMARLRNEKIGIVLQNFALVEAFTGLENVMLPLDFSKGRRNREKEELAFAALEKVGMEDFSEHLVSEMSGGQKQRIAIARAIVNDPDVILADEPTGALDTENSSKILDLFFEQNRCGKTVILVTHDRSVAQRCGRVIEIGDGRILRA